MNKMLTFLIAPITAFFYPPVYHEAAKSSAARGVLYSFYLAGIAMVLVMVLLGTKVMPQVDEFASWTKANMPPLVWTPEGVSLQSGKTSTALVHPKYGTIALFDMTKTSVTEQEMDKAYVFVTAQKIFLKRAPGRMEARDITGAAMRTSGQQLPQKVLIDGATVVKMYQNIKKGMSLLVPTVVLVLSFLFLLLSNLFYSLAGLFFNLTRREKLGYGAIFNLTCFATSVTFTLTWLRTMIPFQGLTFPFVLNILFNLAYMFFAFKVTDKKAEAA